MQVTWDRLTPAILPQISAGAYELHCKPTDNHTGFDHSSQPWVQDVAIHL